MILILSECEFTVQWLKTFNFLHVDNFKDRKIGKETLPNSEPSVI